MAKRKTTYKTFLKRALRARSFRYASDFDCEQEDVVRSINFNGRTIYYRPGSSDVTNIYDKLMRGMSEYWVPDALAPEVIMDIGANVGSSALAFKQQFPNARILCFEPAENNFKLLQKNTAGLDGIELFQFGLGPEDNEAELHGVPNCFGSYSLIEKVSAKSGVVEKVRIRNPMEVLSELGIDNVGLMKIDTEGYEYQILNSITPEFRANHIQWIVGELHSRDDFKLLDMLSQDFDIDMKKTMGKRNSKFHACNRARLPELSKGYSLRWLQR